MDATETLASVSYGSSAQQSSDDTLAGANGGSTQVAQSPQQSSTVFDTSVILHELQDIVSKLAVLLKGSPGGGGDPAQSPVQQSPVKQSPVQQSPVQISPVPPPAKGGPTLPPMPVSAPKDKVVQVEVHNNIKLDNTDKRREVVLRTANGDYVKVSGDPHVEVSIGGKVQKFDVGYGATGFTLPDGTKVSWDTDSTHILQNFKINSVAISTTDNVDVSDVDTGSDESNLVKVASELNKLQGAWNQPLGGATASKPATKVAAKPAKKATPKPAPKAPAPVVVKRGDTLTAIAKKAGTTVAALVTTNGIKNPNLIHPGQKIVIPTKK